MGDFTSIFKGGSKNLQEWNILFWLVAFGSAILMRTFAVNTGNDPLESLSSIFALLIFVGPILIEVLGGDYFTGPARMEESSFAYWLPRILLNIPFIGAVMPFSTFKTASDTFASSAISGVRDGIVTFVNTRFAPSGEDYLFVAIFYATFLAYRELTGNLTAAIVGAAFTAATFFGALHTNNFEIAFFFTAFIFMSVRLIILALTEYEVTVQFANVLVIISWAMFVGIHKGWNEAVTGGIFAAYDSILTLPEPLIFASIAWIIFDIVSLIYAIKFITIDRL